MLITLKKKVVQLKIVNLERKFYTINLFIQLDPALITSFLFYDDSYLCRWCIGVIYYTSDMNLPNSLAPLDAKIEELPCQALNYSFTGYTRACLFWDVNEKTWSGRGCTVID